jgi:hypothetical protein
MAICNGGCSVRICQDPNAGRPRHCAEINDLGEQIVHMSAKTAFHYIG